MFKKATLLEVLVKALTRNPCMLCVHVLLNYKRGSLVLRRSTVAQGHLLIVDARSKLHSAIMKIHSLASLIMIGKNVPQSVNNVFPSNTADVHFNQDLV